MLKKILCSKIGSAASGECVVIGLKLTDAEAYAVRCFGILLFVASLSVLFLECITRPQAQESLQHRAGPPAAPASLLGPALRAPADRIK